ncbi:hypothetical protein Halru_1765 [Halovivax ruber XH-70]|uniref:GINS subunit domain-containing protein n=1 Tax=Halovivax ruber (strain DSM 18193 / JCM 13892 / XH-70) TaxID=797302 RepID=L0IC90_HALRX|nr:hypothetical protein [Halovivax ruber]AGB16364.1 hypothetical protein Halru_1765 [Halovivax ruber XH-70]
MNLEELRSVRNTERQKDSLQELRPSFYQEVGEYIEALEHERDQVAAEHENPFAAPEVTRLTDEIETSKDVAEAIYERRMGKLVKQASLAAAGMTADSDGLTSEEATLFDDLVERIETNKEEILSVLEGAETTVADNPAIDASERDTTSQTEQTMSDPDSANPPVAPADEPHTDSGPDGGTADDAFDAAEAMGAASSSTESTPAEPSDRSTDEATDDSDTDASAPSTPETNDEPAEDSAVARVTVQITADVGSILGVDDREYTLASDDVVTLPEANADPLIERDAAKPLE